MSMAYSLYLQCSEGTMDQEWKVTPVSGPRFWQRMSLQMVQYKPSNLQYPGDVKMCKNTQMNKKKCGTSDIGLMECDNHIKRVSYLLYLDERKPQGGKKTRLCADAIKTTFEHEEGACDIMSDVWQKKYTWRVRYARSMFVLRIKSGKNMSSLSCCIDFHDDLMYGIGLMDSVELFGVKKSQFEKANVVEVRKNMIHMKKLMKKYEEDIGDMN